MSFDYLTFESGMRHSISCRSLFVWNDSTEYYVCCACYYSHHQEHWRSECFYGLFSGSMKLATLQPLGNRPASNILALTQFVVASEGRNRSRDHSRSTFQRTILREKIETLYPRVVRDLNRLIRGLCTCMRLAPCLVGFRANRRHEMQFARHRAGLLPFW